MKHLSRFAAVALIGIAVALGGCAQVTKVWDAATGTTVSPTAVIVAANSFDAVEATATNYLRQKRCPSGVHRIDCRDPAVTKVIIPVVRSGRVARNNLEQFMQDHPGQLGPQGLYDALVKATDTLRNALSQFGIG